MDEWLIQLFPYACYYAYALTFVLASVFLIPNGVKSYKHWGENGKSLYLGISVACRVHPRRYIVSCASQRSSLATLRGVIVNLGLVWIGLWNRAVK